MLVQVDHILVAGDLVRGIEMVTRRGKQNLRPLAGAMPEGAMPERAMHFGRQATSSKPDPI